MRRCCHGNKKRHGQRGVFLSLKTDTWHFEMEPFSSHNKSFFVNLHQSMAPSVVSRPQRSKLQLRLLDSDTAASTLLPERFY